MAGSDIFAHLSMSGLPEGPPPIADDPGPSASERLAPNDFSLEKLLEAAWVLQCLHDQLHNPPVVLAEAYPEPANFQKPLEFEHSSMPAGMNPLVAMPPIMDENSPGVPGQPAAEEPADEIAGGQLLFKSDVVESHVAMNFEAETVQPKDGPLFEELAMGDGENPPEPVPLVMPSLSSPDFIVNARATSQSEAAAESKNLYPPPFPLLEARATDDKGSARSQLYRRIPDLLTSSLQAAVNRSRNAFPNLLPAVRVNLTGRALRATAIATPILLLAMIAGFLLLKTWRHEPFSAQTVATPNTPVHESVVSNPPSTQTETIPSTTPTPTATTLAARPGTGAAPYASHRQVTDPAALSAVQGLSQYEITALRRQAKYGDTSAAFALGMAYELGRPVPQSCAKAAHWVTIAAEAGNSAAEYNLGLRYRDGDGVRANRALSEKWLRRAAARRYANAKLVLKLLASR